MAESRLDAIGKSLREGFRTGVSPDAGEARRVRAKPLTEAQRSELARVEREAGALRRRLGFVAAQTDKHDNPVDGWHH